jgi:hypothetical protein
MHGFSDGSSRDVDLAGETNGAEKWRGPYVAQTPWSFGHRC